tara:strand:- start:4649 stop:6364 length:1716 start_codon:yes stop_codon:yes gene_type:complete
MADQLYFSRDTRLFVQMRNQDAEDDNTAGAGTVWEIPVLDGYSFSQTTNTSEILLSEMESTKGISRRGRRMFTDSLAPAEWSFSTYIRPFKSLGQTALDASSTLAGTKGAETGSGTDVHAVEEVLWAAMFGADVYSNVTGVATVDNLTGATDTDRAAGTYTITEDDYTVSPNNGRGASFTITVNGSGVATVAVASNGDGYAVDDTFTVTSDKIGAAAGDTSLTFDVATLLTTAASQVSTFTRAVNKVSGPVVTPGSDYNTIVTAESNRSALHPLHFYFVVDTASANPIVYKLPEAVINEVSIDFDVEGIATLNWSGMAKEVQDVSGSVHVDATLPIGSDTTTDGTKMAAGDIWFDSDNAQGSAFWLISATPGDNSSNTTATQAIDEAITSTNTFIRNRLTSIDITADNKTIFPGGMNANSDGKYNLALTGGSFTIANNITYLVPDELGFVNKPLEHVTGARNITGGATCYLTLSDSDSTSGTSRQFFNDLVSTSAMAQVVNKFAVTLKIGGSAQSGTPSLVITMPNVHFEVPSHSIEDVISLESSFHALPSGFDTANEITDIKYYAPSTYS